MIRSSIIVVVFISLIAVCAVPMSLRSTVELGNLPSSLTVVENYVGTYYVALVKGDSSLVIMDEGFNVVRRIEGLEDEGVEEVIYHDGRLYLLGFRSGNLLIVEAFASPWGWTISSTIPTGSRLVTGTPINGMIALLSFDEELIVVDTHTEKIVFRSQLPVQALSVATDDKLLYIPLYYNYSLLKGDYVTEESLILMDVYGQVVGNVENFGRRPSYVFLYEDYICVISYLDGTLTMISKYSNEPAKSFFIGRYPGQPFVHSGLIWIPSAGSHRIARIDPSTDEIDYFSTSGRGPSQIFVTDDHVYAIHAVSGKIEKMSHSGETLSLIDLNGYPVDFTYRDGAIAVLIEQSWDPLCVKGWLTIIGDS